MVTLVRGLLSVERAGTRNEEDYQTWPGRIPAGTHGGALIKILASSIVKPTTSSSLSEASDESKPVRRLPLSGWTEESFTMCISPRLEVLSPGGLPEWENIEAVGAADDAARFRIEFEMLELAGSTA